jgi:hypothetical protein
MGCDAGLGEQGRYVLGPFGIRTSSRRRSWGRRPQSLKRCEPVLAHGLPLQYKRARGTALINAMAVVANMTAAK